MNLHSQSNNADFFLYGLIINKSNWIEYFSLLYDHHNQNLLFVYTVLGFNFKNFKTKVLSLYQNIFAS